MTRDHPYRDSELTLADLAERLQTSPHKLSEVLNTQLSQTFYDFVNGYRVREIQRRPAEEGTRNLTLLSLALVGRGFMVRATRDAAVAARAVEARGATLTSEQQDAKKQWDEAYNQALPSRQKLQEEVDNYRRGYGGVMAQRTPVMRKLNFLPVYFPPNIDIWAMMLIGMALFKLGVLQGERPSGFYFRLAALGYAIGVPLNALSTYGTISSDFDIVATVRGGGVAGQAGAVRLGVARSLIDLDPELRGQLKAEGFLTRDAREKERRKYGLKKARKAPQYSKR